jgi:hypothetical protein
LVHLQFSHPAAAHLPSPPHRHTNQLAQSPLPGPSGLPLSSLTDVRALPSSSSLRPAGRAPPSYAPRSRLTGPSPISRAMVRSQPATPSPLTPPSLAASTSPSSCNRRAPPSMVPPSHHRRLVASLPHRHLQKVPRPHLTSP